MMKEVSGPWVFGRFWPWVLDGVGANKKGLTAETRGESTGRPFWILGFQALRVPIARYIDFRIL